MLNQPIYKLNAVPTDIADDLERRFFNPNFDWYLWPSTVDEESLRRGNAVLTEWSVDIPQMTHTFVLGRKANSSLWPMVSKLIPYLEGPAEVEKTVHVERVKANLTLQQRQETRMVPHIDFSPNVTPNWNVTTVIYYVNDSDGDTVLFDGSPSNLTEKMRVTPKKGAMLCFPGLTYHAGTYPLKTRARAVVNFVLVQEMSI